MPDRAHHLFGAAAFVGVWFVAYRRIPDEASVRSLVEIAVTWGGAYVLFFALLGPRHLHMPGILSFLGRISYSIYLLHLPVMQVVANTHISIWLKFLGSVGLTIGLSTLTFYLIEEPRIRLGRWFETLLFPRRRLRENAPTPVAIPVVINHIR